MSCGDPPQPAEGSPDDGRRRTSRSTSQARSPRDARAAAARAGVQHYETFDAVPRIRAGHRVFFHERGEPLFGPGTFDLLVLVDETGSLCQAAKIMGMSYNKAWRAIRQAEDHLGLKLLTRRTGGPDGGGSILTDDGRRLTERFRAFLDEADADLARLYQKYFGDAPFAQPEG